MNRETEERQVKQELKKPPRCKECKRALDKHDIKHYGNLCECCHELQNIGEFVSRKGKK